MKVKILSLNIYEGGLLWENLQKFIQREKPDILCLQEVFNGDNKQPKNFQSIARLKAILPDYYFFYSPEFHEIWPNGQGDTGNAIFSRFKITKEKTVFLDREYQKIIRPKDQTGFSHYPSNLQHVIINLYRKKLNVFNMHGIWGLDGMDTPERLRMSKIIVKEIKGKTSTILMGDFNLKPNTKTIKNIEKYMINIFKGMLVTSFNMKHKTNPGYASAVVDMFFATPDIKIVSKICSDDDVSDHKPLLVTIEI